MVKFLSKGDHLGPVLYCEACGQRIVDKQMGAVLTKTPPGGDAIVDDTMLVNDVM